MLNKLFGTKIGMSQVFSDDRKVIPVTVVNVGEWFVTQVKTKENDGYCALQLGALRKKYKRHSFSANWLKNKSKFFEHINEVAIDEEGVNSYSVGQMLTLEDFNFADNDVIDVAGTSRGLGFQGVIKRWGFAGGPGGHGSTFHRSPGSIGNMCSEGNVIKGKKLPGQCGCKSVTVKNLKVVGQGQGYLFVKGAVPGKKNSLLSISRQV